MSKIKYYLARDDDGFLRLFDSKPYFDNDGIEQGFYDSFDDSIVLDKTLYSEIKPGSCYQVQLHLKIGKQIPKSKIEEIL